MINYIYKQKVNGETGYFCHETKTLTGGAKEHITSRISKSLFDRLKKDKSIIKLNNYHALYSKK